MTPREVSVLTGKILRSLYNYSDALGKQGDLERQKVVRECIQRVHEVYYDIYGTEKEAADYLRKFDDEN